MALRVWGWVLLVAALLAAGCQAKVRPEALATMRDLSTVQRVDIPALGGVVEYRVGMERGVWEVKAGPLPATFGKFVQSMDGVDAVPASDGLAARFNLASPAHFQPGMEAPYATTVLEEDLPEPGRQRFYIRWYRCYEGGGLDAPRRSVLAMALYPLVGLPRDLLDAPITGLRRLHFDHCHTMKGDGDGPANPLLAIAGALFVLAPFALWFAVYKVAPSAVAGYILGGVAALLSLPVLLLLWIYVLMAVGPVFRFVVCMPQTVLLRSWIDSEDYFPNWKFIAHDPQAVAGPRDVPTEWRVLRIAKSREEAEREERVRAWQWFPGMSSALEVPTAPPASGPRPGS